MKRSESYGAGRPESTLRRMSKGGWATLPYRRSGFTLIEMAIALAVIGVLLVSVLQGRAMIANAEYRSFKQSLLDYAQAFAVFRDRYDALPGDFASAEARLGLEESNGNGNGLIEYESDCSEACAAWAHLRAASLTSSSAGAPEHTYNGEFARFETAAFNDGADFGHQLVVRNVPLDVARRLDNDLDDGSCDSGRVSSASEALDPSACSDSEWESASDNVDLIYAL